MRQLVQSVRSGRLEILELPRPTPGPGQVLVATRFSTISTGTERAVRQVAESGLLAKAAKRPDLVRSVLDKARSEGASSALGAVRRRLDDTMPLGYSGSGVVIEAGDISSLRPGQLVATAGAGHADLQVVSANLAVAVPAAVSEADVALGAVGAVAVEAFRKADLGPGSAVAVIGLGIIGQLVARVARAAGCRVLASDPDPFRAGTAERAGAVLLGATDPPDAVRAFARSQGVDAVFVCTGAKNAVDRAALLCRDRGRIVLVGDAPIRLDRRIAYERALTVVASRSYGPGRYDPVYEDLAIDYPPEVERFTAGRNIATFLDLVADERLDTSGLVTHRFEFERFADAYQLIEGADEDHIAVQFDFGSDDLGRLGTRIELAAVRRDKPIGQDKPLGRAKPASSPATGVGILGAGNFVRATLLPAMRGSGLGPVSAVASAGGVSASRVAAMVGASSVVTGLEEMLADDSVRDVIIATPHSDHASQAEAALRAGRNVWCEKPLALSTDELCQVQEAWAAGGGVLMVGFNRRYSPALVACGESLSAKGPLSIQYRVAAGQVAPDHWYSDMTHGGRLIGEVCHMVDACIALTGDIEVTAVHCSSGGAPGARASLLAEEFALTLEFADGSLASILYSSRAHPATPKERIEVFGGGVTAVVDDFRSVTVNGRSIAIHGHGESGHKAARGSGPSTAASIRGLSTRVRSAGGGIAPSKVDKGHARALAAFADACRSGDDRGAALRAFSTTAVVVAAARSLASGETVRPSDVR